MWSWNRLGPSQLATTQIVAIPTRTTAAWAASRRLASPRRASTEGGRSAPPPPRSASVCWGTAPSSRRSTLQHMRRETAPARRLAALVVAAVLGLMLSLHGHDGHHATAQLAAPSATVHTDVTHAHPAEPAPEGT